MKSTKPKSNITLLSIDGVPTDSDTVIKKGMMYGLPPGNSLPNIGAMLRGIEDKTLPIYDTEGLLVQHKTKTTTTPES